MTERHVAVLLVLVSCNAREAPRKSPSAVPMSLPSAVAARVGAPASAAARPPSDSGSDAEFDRAYERKWKAIETCEHYGYVAVMGFGPTVVCLKKEAIAWSMDPKFPPISEGLK
jgi:hypothetical protein